MASELDSVLHSLDTGSSHSPEARLAVGQWQHVGDLRRAKPALLLACFGWPIFTVLDFLHVYSGGGGELDALLALRALPMPWFVMAWVRISLRPPISRREFTVLVYGAIYVLLFAISLECMITGGFESVYAETSLPVLAATTFVPRPMTRNAPRMAVAASIYPIVMILGSLFWTSMHGQNNDIQAINAFVAHTVVLWITTAVVTFASHRVWSLRREIFESRSIGRYALRRRIGKGGMGEVWAAWHRALEREVALKILPLADEADELAAARFEREVRLSSGLTHPNTVRVFDYGTTEDGLLYYAMELLHGVSLGELVRRVGPLPPARAVHLLIQAARALGEAHDREIVHRDVKPENLIVTSVGAEHDYIKVLDFGIARILSEATNLTRTGAVAGTPSTMSPEVITGGPATPASDVYGLGAVLYFALTGRPPFLGEVAASTLIAHLHDPVIPPSVRAPHPIPPDLEEIVMQCLAKSQLDRFPNGRALADALANCSVAGEWDPTSAEAEIPDSANGLIAPPDDPSRPPVIEKSTRIEIRRHDSRPS